MGRAATSASHLICAPTRLGIGESVFSPVLSVRGVGAPVSQWYSSGGGSAPGPSKRRSPTSSGARDHEQAVRVEAQPSARQGCYSLSPVQPHASVATPFLSAGGKYCGDVLILLHSMFHCCWSVERGAMKSADASERDSCGKEADEDCSQ
ncbi:hypothetical protein NDU88_000726 [Pleurodeles waltl]|uniref:Uncharacterized protein n=1 Tax=Pleurodeles waltl TaxID=8319 RepID=A0AAV7U5G6_PLEWA|nr:hypothetical protein NDU88_000726 [Pleurodeles waltl]